MKSTLPRWRSAMSNPRSPRPTAENPIGAVLVDQTGLVVAKGRNRTTEQSGSHLSGTIMAQAEMDALSQVPFGTRIRNMSQTRRRSYHLSTPLWGFGS